MLAENSTNRTILAHTLYPKTNSDGALGFIKPIAEIVDDKLISVDPEKFCPTMKVFITHNYDELESRFAKNDIFKLDVNVSEKVSENIDPAYACKYVAVSKRAEQLKPKEFFEIVRAELPDPTKRIINIDRTYPGTRYIFIDDDTSMYGPFKWSESADHEQSINIEFVDGPLPGVKLLAYQIYKIDRKQVLDFAVTSADSTAPRTIVNGLAFISKAEFHEYASDDEVVKYCAKLASDNNIRVVERSKMDALASYLLKQPKLNYALVKQRLNRLPDIVASVSDAQNEINEGFASYLSSENGKEIVIKYVEENETRFLEKLKKERESELNGLLDSKREEIKVADARLKELNESKVSLSVEVEGLKNLTKQETIIDNAKAKADKELQQKELELTEINNKITEKSALVEGLVNLESIHKAIDEAEQNQKYASKRQYEVTNTLANLEKELKETDDELRKRLTNLKPFVEAINGSFATSESEITNITVKTSELKSSDVLVVSQREVISEIQTRLSKKGRVFSDWQIANILISTQQSFLSFFAGLPGVGKTSLARLLTEVQDIRPRAQEIAVARGWTSQKELIGFYNPLTSRFQSSNTGLYSFLMALSKEKKDHSQAMAYTLLDEANLSPIEHYWSAFMGMTDREGDASLMLGQDLIEIPKCLRFIATINYDGTTEPLSARVVDRSPIIVLEPTDLANISTESSDLQSSFHFPLSAMQMEVLFGNEEIAPVLEEDEAQAFIRIKRTLLDNDSSLGRPLSISPRKELAIRQYCDKARGIMNAENDFLALDVAVMQHVLPLVRGIGPKFAKRLERLRKDLEASSLPRSTEYVTRMIAFGEADLHTYDFFCW